MHSNIYMCAQCMQGLKVVVCVWSAMYVYMYGSCVYDSVYCCVEEPEVCSAVLTRQSAEAQHSAHCDILGNTA